MRDEFKSPNEFENEEVVERASCLPTGLYPLDRRWSSWSLLMITSVAVVVFFIALSFLPVKANRTIHEQPEVFVHFVPEPEPEQPEPEPGPQPEPEPGPEPDRYSSIVDAYDPRQLESFDNKPEEEEESRYQTLPEELPEEQRQFASVDQTEPDHYEIPTIAGPTEPRWEHTSFTSEPSEDSIRRIPSIAGDPSPRRSRSFRTGHTQDTASSVPGTIALVDGPGGAGSGGKFGAWPGSGHGSGGEGSDIAVLDPSFQLRDLPAYYQTVAQSCLRGSIQDVFTGGRFGDDIRESARDWLRIAGEGGGQKELSYRHSGRWTKVVIDSSLALDIDRTEFLAVKTPVGSMSEFAELIEALANDLSSLMGEPDCVERLSGRVHRRGE